MSRNTRIYEPQGSYWGSGSLVADDGTTAQVPEHWAGRLEVVLRRRVDRPLHHERGPAAGPEQSVRSAIRSSRATLRWGSRTCGTRAGHCGRRGRNFVDDPNWDIAAVPENDGTVTSNFNADTFRILGREQPSRGGVHVPHLPARRGLRRAAPALRRDAGDRAKTRTRSSPVLTSGRPRVSTGRWRPTGSPFADNPSFEGFVPNYPRRSSAIAGGADHAAKHATARHGRGDRSLHRGAAGRSSTEPNRPIPGPAAVRGGRTHLTPRRKQMAIVEMAREEPPKRDSRFSARAARGGLGLPVHLARGSSASWR